MTSLKAVLAVTGLVLAAPAAHAAEDCGSLTIAEMNWASAGLAAWVDKLILEEGFGCDVGLVTGDTVPTFTSMNEKGEPDIAPELWVNAVKIPLEAAQKEGRIVIASEILSDGGEEGFWIPTSIAKENDITTIEDALAHPELFPAPRTAARAPSSTVHPGGPARSSPRTSSAPWAPRKRASSWSTADRPRVWTDRSAAPSTARKAGWAITGRRPRSWANTT